MRADQSAAMWRSGGAMGGLLSHPRQRFILTLHMKRFLDITDCEDHEWNEMRQPNTFEEWI